MTSAPKKPALPPVPKRRLRFGSIAEIRQERTASEILSAHGGPEGLKATTKKIFYKALQVKKLRRQLAQLRESAPKKSRSA